MEKNYATGNWEQQQKTDFLEVLQVEDQPTPFTTRGLQLQIVEK